MDGSSPRQAEWRRHARSMGRGAALRVGGQGTSQVCPLTWVMQTGPLLSRGGLLAGLAAPEQGPDLVGRVAAVASRRAHRGDAAATGPVGDRALRHLEEERHLA